MKQYPRVDGQKIIGIRTIGSWYDNNCVDVFLDDGSQCRMKSSTIEKMVNEFTFEAHKKHKYIHLEKPELKVRE